MRKRLVLVILIGLFVGFGVVMYRRAGDPPASNASASTTPSTSPDDTATAPSDASTDSDADSEADGATESGFDRSLRVASPSLELLAPGILANGGFETAEDSIYHQNDVDVSFRTVEGIEAVRKALARGGRSKQGADIAIVPLPSFVASYEQLRALKPRVFYVVGRSRGREALATTSKEALIDPPESDPIDLRGLEGESATFLSLFAMELAGIPLETVELKPEDDRAPYAAVGRSHPELSNVPDDHELLISTAAALGLVPFVAIAPRGFVNHHPEVLYDWTSGWLEGKAKLRESVPQSARRIARQSDDVQPLALIDRLGWLEFASPRDNAQWMGLSGRAAINLERLFQMSWRIWRESGVLTTPSPEALPISTRTIVRLVRSDDRAENEEMTPSRETFSGDDLPEEPQGDVLLVHRRDEDDLDERAFVASIGLVAAIFPRSRLRVTVDWNRPMTNKIIEQARKRFNLHDKRLVPGRYERGPGNASIEVFEVQ